jgi:aryl-alcohol dehydrogenase-like predicted oxidoreductase
MMEYRILGKDGLKISEMGFGCMSLGMDDNENERLMMTAIEAGINFFDTADLYQQGQNEATVGKALKKLRNHVIISTKVGNQLTADGKEWVWNPRKSYILEAVNRSLQRLQTDYIDYYQLHGGTINDPIDETIEAFEILKSQGKIRFYGISSIRPNVVRAYAWRSHCKGVMMQYSLLDRRPEESCLPFLKDKQIGILARGVLAGGLLLGKPATPYLNYPATTVEKIQEIAGIFDNSGKTAFEVSLGYVLQSPGISAAIIGIRNLEQLSKLLRAWENCKISEIHMNKLQQILPINYYKDHR